MRIENLLTRRDRPVRCENLLTRPDPTRKVLNTSRPTPPDPTREIHFKHLLTRELTREQPWKYYVQMCCCAVVFGSQFLFFYRVYVVPSMNVFLVLLYIFVFARIWYYSIVFSFT